MIGRPNHSTFSKRHRKIVHTASLRIGQRRDPPVRDAGYEPTASAEAVKSRDSTSTFGHAATVYSNQLKSDQVHAIKRMRRNYCERKNNLRVHILDLHEQNTTKLFITSFRVTRLRFNGESRFYSIFDQTYEKSKTRNKRNMNDF